LSEAGSAGGDAGTRVVDGGVDGGDKEGDLPPGSYYGEKRWAEETIESVADVTLLARFKTGVADHGDSGGPLLCGGLIVATTSCHDDGWGTQHKLETYARADNASAWIKERILTWEEPVDAAPGSEGGVGPGLDAGAGGEASTAVRDASSRD
jgi:hypothetical protein